MDLDRTHGLAFLLSLAALPMAGCPAATEDTTTGTGDTTGDSQTSDPSTDPSTVSITSADTTDASMSMGTTVEPTTDPSTDPTTLTDPTDPTDATTEGTRIRVRVQFIDRHRDTVEFGIVLIGRGKMTEVQRFRLRGRSTSAHQQQEYSKSWQGILPFCAIDFFSVYAHSVSEQRVEHPTTPNVPRLLSNVR